MGPELEKDLVRRYPWMFRDESGAVLRLPIECGNGWFRLLERLLATIHKEIQRHKSEPWAKNFRLLQVKEKFGQLVVYYRAGNERTDRLVSAAWSQSARTCEGCGRPGKVRNREGWSLTRCGRCWREAQRDT